MDDIFTLIKSAILIIAAVLVVLTSIGLLRYDDMERILYARVHMLGVADMACIVALLSLNEPLLAVVYFFLTPFASHAIANAYYYGEEKR